MKLILIIIILVFIHKLYGQESKLKMTTNSLPDQIFLETDTTGMFILPLAALLDSAMMKSPVINGKKAEIEELLQELKIEKKRWLDHIHLVGNANYGSFNQVVLNQYTGDNNTVVGSQNEQMYYYSGISFKMPFSAFASRRNEIKIKKAGMQRVNYDLLEQKNEIKKQIIIEYYQLAYYKESMMTFQKVCQTLEISYLKAVKDLENGNIELDEFAALVTAKGKAKDSYLKSQNNFYTQYYKLLILTGTSFR